MKNNNKTPLTETQTSLRKYNASRKLKKAANRILAVQRMSKLVEASKANLNE